MDDRKLLALNILVRQVTERQNCVMQLIIGEEGMIAHLIPLDAYIDMAGYEDEEDEEDE